MLILYIILIGGTIALVGAVAGCYRYVTRRMRTMHAETAHKAGQVPDGRGRLG